MILGIRHGERADNSSESYELEKIQFPYDPHLTLLGELQARITAHKILQKIEEYEESLKKSNFFKSKIQPIIITSPFLRTIQTSYQIAKELGPIYQDTIFLQEDIQELLDDHKTFGFDQDPRPRLFSKVMKLEEFQNYGIDFINGKIKLKPSEIYDPEYKTPTYPELKKDCDSRAEKFIKSFTKIFFKKFKFNEHLLIFVTHQYLLASCCWTLKKTNIHEFPLEKVGYCGILDCRLIDPEDCCEKFDVLQLGSNEHIQDYFKFKG